MTVTPVAIYWIVLFAFIKTLYKTLVNIRRTVLEESQWSMNRRIEDGEQNEIIENVLCYFHCFNIYKDDILNLKLFTSIVLTPLFKYFWDAIDLTLDLYIFYQLENGEVLDDVIYRNENVNNSIYAFAILGCICKVFTWRFFQNASKKNYGYYYSPIKFLQMKNMVMVASFIFEDGPEMLLEYFYIEKYVTKFSWVLLVKDIFVGIVAVGTCLNTLAYLLKDKKQ